MTWILPKKILFCLCPCNMSCLPMRQNLTSFVPHSFLGQCLTCKTNFGSWKARARRKNKTWPKSCHEESRLSSILWRWVHFRLSACKSKTISIVMNTCSFRARKLKELPMFSVAAWLGTGGGGTTVPTVALFLGNTARVKWCLWHQGGYRGCFHPKFFGKLPFTPWWSLESRL